MGPEKQGDTPTYPDLIGIPVGRQFEELHLLHCRNGRMSKARRLPSSG